MGKIFGYVFTSVLTPIVVYLAGHYWGNEAAVAAGTILATIGGRVLHLQDPPSAK